MHKCLIASPNLCQIVAPNGSLGSFCTKLLRQINICDQSAPKMCAKFCLSRCSALKIFWKYTLKFTLGKMYKYPGSRGLIKINLWLKAAIDS
jgi:hypothetical protein